MEVSGQLHIPAVLTPGKELADTHRIVGWVGSRAILDAVVKRKIHSPLRESNPRTPIVPSCIGYTAAEDSEQWKWEENGLTRGRNRHWPTLRQSPRNVMEALRKPR
jgi:hypothetical protein